MRFFELFFLLVVFCFMGCNIVLSQPGSNVADADGAGQDPNRVVEGGGARQRRLPPSGAPEHSRRRVDSQQPPVAAVAVAPKPLFIEEHGLRFCAFCEASVSESMCDARCPAFIAASRPMPPPPIPGQLMLPAPASSQAASLPYSREEQKRAAARERQARRRLNPAVLAAEAAARAVARSDPSVRAPERARDAAAHSAARQNPSVRAP
jgi:hypothetical protein